MKHNIQKSILLPFIIFTVILTALLVAWSGVFIKTFLYEHEAKTIYSQLKSVQSSGDHILSSYDLTNLLSKNFKDIKTILGVYDGYYPSYSLYSVYKRSNSPFQIPLGEQPRIVNHSDNQVYWVQQGGKRNKNVIISINLSQFLSSFTYDSNIVGLITLNEDLTIRDNVFNMSLSSKQYDDLKNNISQFVYHHDPLKKSLSNSGIVFERSQRYPSIIYVAINDQSAIMSVIIQITIGIILVILLSTSWVFIMDLLIIRKMTTSIDILRSVSKKVAQGDFTEKVYIQSSDEIGELSKAFNQMVEQLKESTDTIVKQNEQSDAIIKCIPDGIIVTDFKNNLIVANKKAEDIFEFDTKENYLNNISQFIQHSSLQEHSRQLKKSENFTSELSYTRESHDFILLMHSTVVHNSYNKPIGIIYLIRDVTHEKEIEKLREGFLRTVSHELRTPLTSVIGFIELVTHSGKTQLTEEQQSCLRTALNEARILKELINDLLELSQMQAKKTNLVPTSLNVFSFIDSITNSLSPLTTGKQLDLINNVTDKNLVIMVDKAKLRRILVNLISNGIKFTQEGYVKISCVEKDEFVEFCISDTGIGLKDIQQDVIFEKFRQVDYSSTREFEGIGLGLSIVKELVQLHEGDVRVESDFGQGSSFYFTLKKKRNLTASMVT